MTTETRTSRRAWPARWFRADAEPQAAPVALAAPCEVPEDARTRGRRLLLADMTSFLLTHRLKISPTTLRIAYDLMTSSDAALGRKVWQRLESNQTIDDEWLLENARCTVETSDDKHNERRRKLMDMVQTAVHDFAQTAGDAHTATSACNSALEKHATDLGTDLGNENSAAAVLRIEAILHDMLTRTRKLETELDRSARATRNLEKRLTEARRAAAIDHLTGLPNRREFENVFVREVAIARRNGEPLCIAFCDIDHFKLINDEHGHEAGDRILRGVARSFAALSDDTCHVARHGGEEFVAILRGRTLDQAFAILDAAREDMANRKFVNRDNDRPIGQVTYSAGVAQLDESADLRAVLRAADKALYFAKQEGRNCVRRADRLPQPVAEVT